MNNQVADIIRKIGIAIIVCGIIAGIYQGNNHEIFSSSYGFETDDDFHWLDLLVWSIYGFISGMVFIGLSEIIEILNNIHQSLSKDYYQEKEDKELKKSLLSFLNKTDNL